jgi:hypothetical protein
LSATAEKLIQEQQGRRASRERASYKSDILYTQHYNSRAVLIIYCDERVGK